MIEANKSVVTKQRINEKKGLFHFCLLRRLFNVNTKCNILNFFSSTSSLFLNILISALYQKIYENILYKSLFLMITALKIFLSHPISSFKLFLVISDIYVATCVIQNSRIIQNAWLCFFFMQLPWLDNRTNLTKYCWLKKKPVFACIFYS